MLALTTRSRLPSSTSTTKDSRSPISHSQPKLPLPSTICLRNELISSTASLFHRYQQRSAKTLLSRGGFNNAGDLWVSRGILRQMEDHRALNAPPLNKKLY